GGRTVRLPEGIRGHGPLAPQHAPSHPTRPAYHLHTPAGVATLSGQHRDRLTGHRDDLHSGHTGPATAGDVGLLDLRDRDSTPVNGDHLMGPVAPKPDPAG